MATAMRATRGSRRGPRARAFTLLEVMNFLALAGILSAVGMYGLARYVRHTKTAEALASVSSLAQSAASFYNASDATQPTGTTPEAMHAMRHFPPASLRSVPPSLEDVRGKRYQSAVADWGVSPWRDLRFALSLPQYYAYTFEASGTGGTARAAAIAEGDLDGDGHASKYRLGIAPDASYAAQVSQNFEKTEPEE